jgi:hypothetical protein
MSADRHRFRHLTDHDYHGLFGEVKPLPSSWAEPLGGELELAFPSEAAFLSNESRSYDPSTGRWTCQDPLRFEREPAHLYPYPARNGGDSALGPASSLENLSYGGTERGGELEEGLHANRAHSYEPNPGVWIDYDGGVVPADPLPQDRPPTEG